MKERYFQESNMLVDTHAHIHFEDYENDIGIIFENCKETNVKKIITVGTDEIDSKKALEFCFKHNAEHTQVYASAGLHPHSADSGEDSLLTIKDLVLSGGYGSKLVAVGECGLDYYRNQSSKQSQIKALEFQIELAIDQSLPLIFHVRDAWEDFFAIIRKYPEARGVIHSFTGGTEEVRQASQLNLYFGLNGIMTFTKDPNQLEAAKAIPSSRLVLETDCPFLTPEPKRGKRNEPANIKYVAEFLAKLRGETFSQICQSSSTNAKTLFGLK